MNTIQNKTILTSILVISLAILVGITQPLAFAEESHESQYTQANQVEIYTEFSFREAVEKSYGFQVYNQISGFGGESHPSFKLEGHVSADKLYLYEAVDSTHSVGSNTFSKYGQFDVDIYLQQGESVLRHFNYVDCRVIDYQVTTLFDKEEGWNTSKGFAVIDEFTFECAGFHPYSPMYELMKNNG